MTGLDTRLGADARGLPQGRPAATARADRGPAAGQLTRRDQLEHATRTACQIIKQPAVIVVGADAWSKSRTRTPPHHRELRAKDRNFVAALFDSRLVDAELITKRLTTVPTQHRPATQRGLAWLAAGR
jgi:hypothetical protein